MSSRVADDICTILKRVLGDDNCQQTIELFEAQEIDAEAFYSLDKEVLVELGKYILLLL